MNKNHIRATTSINNQARYLPLDGTP